MQDKKKQKRTVFLVRFWLYGRLRYHDQFDFFRQEVRLDKFFFQLFSLVCSIFFPKVTQRLCFFCSSLSTLRQTPCPS